MNRKICWQIKLVTINYDWKGSDDMPIALLAVIMTAAATSKKQQALIDHLVSDCSTHVSFIHSQLHAPMV